jgi:Flp pilus assembly protein TadG
MRWRDDLGAVAVETVFAMVFILVPLLIGVTDLGRALYSSIVVEEVAQEGAMFQAFEGASNAAVVDRVRSATSFPDLSAATVTSSCTTVVRAGVSGSRVTVTVNYQLVNFFLPPFNLSQFAVAEGSSPCP